MSKLLSSKFNVCKNIKGKYKNLWGTFKSKKLRSVKIFLKNTFIINQKLNRLSSFGKFLNTKQCLKSFYLIKETFLQFLLRKATLSFSKTINKLISFLESKLDTVLYRACFVNSLYMARQLINHGFINLNSKQQLRSKKIMLNSGDTIEIKIKNISFKKNLIAILKQRQFKQHYKITTKRLNLGKKKLAKIIIKILNNKNRNITPIFINFLKKKSQYFLITKLTKLQIIPKNLEANFKLFKIVFLWDPNMNKVYYPIKIKYKKHSHSFFYSYNEILYQD
jgi:small subunit ribosomal protein S4